MAQSQTLRGRALEKLATLSAKTHQSSSARSPTDPDFVKLCEACPAVQSSSKQLNGTSPYSTTSTAKVPMSLRELEVLLALCHTAPSIHSVFSANRLLQQISPYLVESCYQALASTPILRRLGHSPWERLTSSLAEAVLSIGIHHPSVRDKALASLDTYIHSCIQYASIVTAPQALGDSVGTAEMPSQEAFGLMKLATSLLGFLEAAYKHARFWHPQEQRELVQSLESLITERLLVALEAAVSSMRTAKALTLEMREWKHFIKQYAIAGEPLGAMALRQNYMKLIASCSLLFVTPPTKIHMEDPLKALMTLPRNTPQNHNMKVELLVEKFASIAAREVVSLEEGADYLHFESAWQQRMSYNIKASSLICFLCCSLVNDDIADIEVLMSWLDASLADSTQVSDEVLASTVLRCMAVIAKTSSTHATLLSRTIPKLLVRSPISLGVASVASDCLVFVLKLLPQDTAITTLYSLGNSLSVRNGGETPADFSLFGDKFDSPRSAEPNGKLTNDSNFNLASSSNSEDTNIIHGSVIQAIVAIAQGFKDEKITALAVPMLVQKVGKTTPAMDYQILTEATKLSVQGGTAQLRAILRLFTRIQDLDPTTQHEGMRRAVTESRDLLSRSLKGGSALYDVYFQDLLEMIISKGDVPAKDSSRSAAEFESVAQDIAGYLRPLALLIANNVLTEGIEDIESYPRLQRDAWYNIVVHGFNARSAIGTKHIKELMVLAQYSQPLIGNDRVDQLESDIELSTILRRGMHSENINHQRREMTELLPNCESDIRSLNYPELMFLKAAHLVETMRAARGDSTQALLYFVEPKMRSGALGACMTAVAIEALETFLAKTVTGRQEYFSAPFAAEQLALIFQACCHRVESVQNVAYICANRLITQVPSALCHRKSIFSLLDILTIMWTSCLEAEMDEYEWNSEYTSQQGSVKLQLSDDYSFRRQTLTKFHAEAKKWMRRAIDIAPLDVKGLLQTYLSDYSDDEAFGHMSLGRSFAFDMGALIPRTDQRLGAIEPEDNLDINTASDFMAQYTSRQEYRFSDPSSARDRPDQRDQHLDESIPDRQSKIQSSIADHDVKTALAATEQRVLKREHVPIEELRNLMRRAASLLCHSTGDESTVVSHFVKIPYIAFTRPTIKIGLSLWVGVIKENPRMEPKILTDVIEGWITTVRDRKGIFNSRINHSNPFYVKEEFAPSDKEYIIKQQRRANDNIMPHFRILQFLSSHYTATRLSSTSIEKAYHRFLRVTLQAMRHCACHPLTREIHFHVILLGFRVMKHSTSLDSTARWRLKDNLLSAGLAWFSHAPRWSFGGNRLQVKAETQTLLDVAKIIQETSNVGVRDVGALKSLQAKQDLLLMLLASEQNRLNVWLFPLVQQKKNLLPYHQGQHGAEFNTSTPLITAWNENPAIAVHLISRFQTQKLAHDVRTLILNNPEKVVDEPDALMLLLGTSLTDDINSQLKYLAYWAPVNPITAVTYFLPAYGNHPSIVQYAVRALESHSVDVTFFYVPQIVQALRYDVLGYVGRYIIETGKVSQLFAHQIIWNMNANAYKDEDSQEPDPVKPTLDKVSEKLIASFSDDDRGFYEREFSFFGEITGISGKLRPFIKKSKPEKKQKIEEELRKIQVEVGVYLPCNPDGVVVGIDRKSGKPLQSHAKAPYMATFRIKKEVIDDMDHVEEQLEEANAGVAPAAIASTPASTTTTAGGANGTTALVPSTVSARRSSHASKAASSSSMSQIASHSNHKSYEVWQSAIFKVGDDCRQDVLALQMIAAFRGIFHHVGLPVYVFPYRVTATAPGCGVIDVLPNSISRDMLGREAVNGLYDWFVTKFGGEDAPAFQMARANFVKSLAAYSVISYLLQFKDRHNGNIMLDDQGHILHIDFGFCFDIAPGGVRFERAPFKLTKEMVAVMGGATTTQSFRWFEELCVKAFLAARPYAEPLAHLVVAMLDSGLPCFKPETSQHFRDRFVLDKSERDAAEFMRFLVKKSHGSYSTKGYDQFQLMTNGIPY